jgi:hypothetical protein
MNPANASGGNNLKPILLFIGALILAGLVGWWWLQPRGNADPEAIRLHQLAVEANGALENENYSVGTRPDGTLRFGFEEAIPRYEEIRRLRPDEELPYRNLVIAWLLMLRSPAAQDIAEGGGESLQVIDTQTAKVNLVDAMGALWERFENPATTFLYGEVQRTLGGSRSADVQAAQQYLAAATAAQDHAPFWYSAFWIADEVLTSSTADAATLEPIRAQAIRELRRLEPNNLWVISKSLVRMAADQDPELADYWQRSRALIEKAGFSSKNYLGQDSFFGDLSPVIQALDQAVNDRDGQRCVRAALDLDNSLRNKSPAVIDLASLQPNPLDYLLDRFSDPITQAANAAAPAVVDAATITFSEVTLPDSVTARPILDFALADIDFDGVLDLFILRDDAVEVHVGPLTSLAADPILRVPVTGQYDRLHAAFLLTIADSGSGIQRRFSQAAGRMAGKTHAEFPQLILTGDQGLAAFKLDWTPDSGLAATAIPQPEEVAEMGRVDQSFIVDFDQDSDLDLVVLTPFGLRLLMNRGNNTFIDASQWLYLPDGLDPIVDVQLVDWDRDLFIDFVVQTRSGRVGLLGNERHGAFRYRDLNLPVATEQPGLAVAELDGNASWDLVTSNAQGTTVQFTQTEAWGKVQFLSQAPGASATAGTLSAPGQLLGEWAAADFDNSGTLDLLLWQDGQLVYHPTQWHGTTLAQGSERLKLGSSNCRIPLDAQPQRGDRGDWDGDGDLDLLVWSAGRLQVFKNDGGNRNAWLTVVAQGRGDNASRTNHLGIGSLFEARIGQHYFAETITRPTVHVGLGQATEVNVARIIWTNGIPQVLLLPAGRQTVEMLCILKGSCPFIYTWNGEQWVFFSDCLWAAPIGLQAPQGGLVPTRHWEYLRLPPESLVATDGTYRVLLTEELWEVAYFDQVRLLTIDHPADVEVHINDKVGPPQIVAHRLYRVGEKHSPVAATNQRGEDVRPQLLEADQQYVRSFERRITQGYVEPHELILEFDQPDLEEHTLFLTGWIQPTDTSINVMLQQQPELTGPVFPALFVPAANGEWIPAPRPMGFPGGKTKTMAVPLNDLFPTSDQRLKIVTSSEIYWDQAYVARDQPQVDLLEQAAPLASAHTYYRGTSRRLPLVPNGPETFDASDVTTAAVWPPVAGRMSEYGPAEHLVQEADDRMVTLGTGDALEVTFAVPSQPTPPGHVRTFLLYTIGYDKDSDLHTVEGQRIEPLPFRDMASYPDYSRSETATSAGQRVQNWYRFWHQIQNPYVTAPADEPKVPRGQYRRN